MDTSSSSSQIGALVRKIAEVGAENSSTPVLNDIEPFAAYLLPDGSIDQANLDRRDGACTRREVLVRFLLLSAVIDQGPDIVGVRRLLAQVINSLYRAEIRPLHSPLSFFAHLGVAIDVILKEHDSVKQLRAAIWAKENRVANAAKYNLFMDNSTQALSYAVFRWGVPLAVPLVLHHDCTDSGAQPSVLADYIETWESSEIMSRQIKDHQRYGLGKAIGDKACHLFAKWVVSSFALSRRKDSGWGTFSFEVPYDSNAGRVLWRTGYLLTWALESDFVAAEVVQKDKGKGGTRYIRVTNIRGMAAQTSLPVAERDCYESVCVNDLKTNKRRPRKVEIQRIQHAYLRSGHDERALGPAEFDDGLIRVGTGYCFNHAEPLCPECPIHTLCEGYKSRPELISDYRT